MPELDSQDDGKLYNASSQANMNAGGSTYQDNGVIRIIPTQGNAPVADTSNKVTQGNDDDACPEHKFSGTSQMVPGTDENSAPLTAVTGQSNLIHDHFPAPSPYDTPHPTVYDPTGHYARGKSKLTCWPSYFPSDNALTLQNSNILLSRQVYLSFA